MTISFNPFEPPSESSQIFDMVSRPIGLNGVYDKAIIGYTNVQSVSDYDDIRITTLSPLHRGDKIIYDNKRWLVIGDVATERHGKYKSIMRQVTHPVRIQTGVERVYTGEIDEYGNPIYTEEPVYSDCEIIIMDSPAISIQTAGAMAYVDGKVTMVMPDDESSAAFETDFEFNLASSKWRVVYADISKHGLKILSVDKYGTPEEGYEDEYLPAPVMPEPPALPTIPDAPVNITASNVTDDSATISWNEVSNADTYSVYRDNILIASGLTTLSYTDDGLSELTTYNYSVTATNELGESDHSANVQVETTETPQVPDAPTGLNFSDVTETTLTLSWNAMADVTYTVYRDGISIASGLTEPTYNDSGLTGNTTYTYQVSATNTVGESAHSAPTEVTTDEPIPVPDAPTGLKATDVTTDAITVMWNPSAHATSYNLYFNYDLLDSNITDTTYTITDLTSNNYYYFSVVAKNSSGSSAESQMIMVQTIPDEPTNLIASEVTDNSVTLTWNDMINVTFNVYRNGEKVASDLTEPTFNDGGLTAETTYQYQVSATNSSGESALTAAIDVTTTAIPTVPDAPTNLVGTADGYNAVDLTWNSVTDADTYNVYRDDVVVATGLTVTSYRDTDLESGTTYSYQVSAVNEVGESERSTAASATTDASPEPQVVFSDDFNRADGELGNGWTVSQTNLGTVIPAITNGQVDVTPDTNSTLELFHETGITDGDFSVRFISGFKGSGRINIRYADAQHRIMIVGMATQYKIIEYDGGNQSTYYDVVPADSGVFRVHADGQTIQLYVDDTLIFTHELTYVQSGTNFGVGSYNARFVFDDVVVSSI